ncbi:GAF domain-containing protein [Streptomyces melanogenes]|uniref:GAF domain-containing protein n=1 Tax=Streptomyces melanogenes TaxID=67326 RepID=A0ABZ1XM74_9ACTN|nr:GAF domain-containing protein [Streptomyces melanogenes]
MAKRPTAAAAHWEPDDGEDGSGALEILELLAAQASLDGIDEVLLRAHDRGATADELAVIHRAGRLGRTVHGLLDRRRRREADLAALLDTARELASSCDVDGLVKTVAHRTRALLQVDMAFVALLTTGSGDSVIRASAGATTSLHMGLQLPGKHGIGAVVRATGAPFWTSDYQSETRVDHDPELDAAIAREGIRSVLALPMHHASGTVGVLYAAHRDVRHFEPDEAALLGSLADLAAAAVDKAQWLELYNAEVAKLEEHSALAMETIETERWLEAVRDHIIGFALSGQGVAGLAAEVGVLLDAEILVRDHRGRILAGREETWPPLPPPTASPRTPMLLDAGTWQAAIWAGTTWLGHILARPRTALTPEGERMLAYAGQAVALAVGVGRGAAGVGGFDSRCV